MDQSNAGASTVGLNASCIDSTNGRSGRMLLTTSIQRGIADSSIATNVLEMNAIGRITALATAGAASALRISPATATPSAENVAAPTANAISAAGSLAASTSVP